MASEGKDKRIERYNLLLKDKLGKVDDFDEHILHEGVGVSSIITLQPSKIQIYSKCFDHEAYGLKKPIERDPDAVSVSDIYDGKGKVGLDVYESKIIQGLNDKKLLEDLSRISGEKGINLAPEFYGHIPEEKRFLASLLIDSNHWPTMRDEFISIDKQIYQLHAISQENGIGLSNDLMGKIVRLKDMKKDLIGKGLYYLARLHYAFNKNPKLFGEIKTRKSGEELDRQEEYITNMLRDSYKDKEFKSDEEFQAFLLKEKKISIREYLGDFRKRKRGLYLSSENSSINKPKIIHGDFGIQHMTHDGVTFDHDETREDIPQDDVVRFVNSEIATENAVESEADIVGRYADYFIDFKRFNDEIRWNDKNRRPEELLRKHREEFQDFLILAYAERLEENIHMYSSNKKFMTKEPHRLEQVVNGHPVFSNIDALQDYRLHDINTILFFLLGTRYGREKILGSHRSSATNYFEEIRNFFERSGLLREPGNKSENGGSLLDF